MAINFLSDEVPFTIALIPFVDAAGSIRLRFAGESCVVGRCLFRKLAACDMMRADGDEGEAALVIEILCLLSGGWKINYSWRGQPIIMSCPKGKVMILV